MREKDNKDLEKEHTGIHRNKRKIDRKEPQIDKEK
jgi:hypothetical protein